MRIKNFHPLHKEPDPAQTQRLAFNAFKQRLHTIPTRRKPGKLPLLWLSQALLYPDTNQWPATHDQDLEKLDDAIMVDWTNQELRGTRPLPLKVSYR